jgi:hypothetical protein
VASVTVKMFSHAICYIKNRYRCIFNAIWKDDAAINCIAVQNKETFILTGYTTLVHNNSDYDDNVPFPLYCACYGWPIQTGVTCGLRLAYAET